MDSESVRPPIHGKSAFHCPQCGVLAKQTWGRAFARTNTNILLDTQLDGAVCENCQYWSVWSGIRMVYPSARSAPRHNPDLPADAIDDYEEAASIVANSPRGASALLRLVVQKLCKALGEPGKNINDDIAALVKKGLSPLIQQALDVVRVIGNNAVHPGELDLKDDPETALKLFGLVNLITDAMVSQPKQISALFDSLPHAAKAGIKKRDGSSLDGFKPRAPEKRSRCTDRTRHTSWGGPDAEKRQTVDKFAARLPALVHGGPRSCCQTVDPRPAQGVRIVVCRRRTEGSTSTLRHFTIRIGFLVFERRWSSTKGISCRSDCRFLSLCSATTSA